MHLYSSETLIAINNGNKFNGYLPYFTLLKIYTSPRTNFWPRLCTYCLKNTQHPGRVGSGHGSKMDNSPLAAAGLVCSLCNWESKRKTKQKTSNGYLLY